MYSLSLVVYGGVAIMILRIALGTLIALHGWPKLKNLTQTAQNFEGMGFKPGRFWGTVVALSEFFGGVALILGFMVQIAAALVILQFATIIVWKNFGKIPFKDGWEIDFILLVVALTLFIVGGGAYSLDRALFF